MRRIISMLLALVMVFTAIPWTAMAEETQNDTTVDTGEVTVEGTNGFGRLLSADIQEYQEDTAEEYQGGYTVTDLVIEGNTATVTYDALGEANLVVALYTEDGIQLLTSANTTVTADATEATVTFAGDMPEYFLASAYLVDTYDFSPLCESYDTPMYTQDMQELLASTVEDYDPDRVLQMTEDDTTNFAVYADEVILIDYTEGANTVIAPYSEEETVYVIENADENITSLRVGDTFAYAYGENEILIIKVGAISVDGTTVTITADETIQMEDVFSHVKIEAQAGNAETTVDETAVVDGVAYEGFKPDNARSGYSTYAYEDDIEIAGSFEFSINKDLYNKDGVSVSIAGSLGLEIKTEMDYYISLKHQYLSFKVTAELFSKLGITGKIETKMALLPITQNFYGITVGFEPELVLEFQATCEFECTYAASVGFAYNSGDFQDLSSKPKFDSEINVEGTIFFGLNLKPVVKAEIVTVELVTFEFSAPAGIEIKGEEIGTNLKGESDSSDSIHSCRECLKLTFSYKISLSLTIRFLEVSWLEATFNFVEWTQKLFDMYWSMEQSELGFGSCPYQTYRVTVLVKDTAGKVREDVSVLRDTTPRGQTNSKGVYVEYVPAGIYTYSVNVDGETLRNTANVKQALKITLRPGKDDASSFDEADSLEDVLDLGSLINAGFCGAEGSNVTWALSEEGVLTVFGTGAMANYTPYVGGTAPWFANSNEIISVVIRDGVTSIGSYAFNRCWSLKSVTIGDSVTTIGDSAFSSCYELTSVTIPDSVTSIEHNAFGFCSKLASVTIPDSVTSIGDNAFQRSGLISIHIPESVTSLGENVFSWCDRLTGIHVSADNPNYSSDARGVLFNKAKTKLLEAPGAIEGEYAIPNAVTTIGWSAFDNCRKLTGVTIPNSVTTIGWSAFSYCFGLLRVDIPASVTSIERYAFSDCHSLTGIHVAADNPNYSSDESGVLFNKEKTQLLQAPGGLAGEYVIPDTVVSFDDNQPFRSCYNLIGVTIGNGIWQIDSYVFGYCENLSSVTMPRSVIRIWNDAFADCESLTDVYYAGTEAEWNAINIDEDNDYLTTATIHYNSTGPAAGTNVAVTQGQAASGEDAPTLDAVYGGEYSTEETEGITLKKATFSGLVPGEQYLLLAMASIDTDAPIAPENLLYIDQAAAAEDGTLTFTYVQRVTTDPSFVVACGAASKTLADAAITFPEMIADGELHAVEPTVVYDGTTLQEGRDYEITGTVSYTEAGTYVCYIRGIHNYTGTMKCTYTVADAEEPEVPTDPTDPEEPTDPEVPTDPVDPEEPELDDVIRIAGDDRIATSLMLAAQLKEVLRVEKFDAVVVASALNFPDALTGSYLAAEKDAPILLTYPAAHAKIRAYIQENLKPGGMVYILGGEGAVSADFANGLGGLSIKRLAGSDRFGTNLEIMKEAGNYTGKPVLIATAVNFADSLSASAAGLPMVLVYGSLREDQKEFLATTSKNFIIIGGEAAVSPALEAELKAIGSVTRVAGSSRYETSVLVAEKFIQNPDAVILAYAKNFPDGLCGGPLAYALGAPLILTDSGAPGTADGYVRNITSGIVVGGAGLISDAAARDIFDLAANAEIPQTGR